MAGRIDGQTLTSLGDLVEKYGASGARLTAQQKVVVLGVDEADVEALIADLSGINLEARPSNWRRSTMACTGIEFCKLAIVDTKQRSIDLVAELEKRFPDLDTPISVNVNGCPNACARTQVADIGLKGMLVMDDHGDQVEGFQVHLGGSLGPDRGLRQEAARPQGDQRRARRLHHHRRRQLPRTSVRPARASPPGQSVPTRSCSAARRRSDVSARAVPFHCPYCGDENLWPHEAEGETGSGHGQWECRSCLRAFKLSHDRPAAAPDDHAHHADGDVAMTARNTLAARARRGSETEGRDTAELREIVSHVGAELELAPAEDIIEWAVATFGERFCVTSSMSDAVLSHLASRVAPGVDVLFLDTGYHFAETIGTRDAVEATMPVNLINLTPVQSVAEQDAAYGKDLFERDPDLCCALRKVQPLADGLGRYDAWATGLRRAETHNRVIAPVVGWDEKKQKVKVSPLARWSDEDVEKYIAENGILVNPLQYDGYPSIGCWPCTRRVAPGEDARAGRWSGTNKTECGIHQ